MGKVPLDSLPFGTLAFLLGGHQIEPKAPTRNICSRVSAVVCFVFVFSVFLLSLL